MEDIKFNNNNFDIIKNGDTINPNDNTQLKYWLFKCKKTNAHFLISINYDGKVYDVFMDDEYSHFSKRFPREKEEFKTFKESKEYILREFQLDQITENPVIYLDEGSHMSRELVRYYIYNM